MAQKAQGEALKEARKLENRTRSQNQSQKLGATRTKNTRHAAGRVKVDLTRAFLVHVSHVTNVAEKCNPVLAVHGQRN